jgi:ABC-type uncharacterized transport system permease subunit
MNHHLQFPRLACLIQVLQPSLQLDLIPYPLFQLKITFSTFTSFSFFNPSLISMKPSVEMMATLCSNHIPLRFYFPKIIFTQTNLFPFPFQIPQNPSYKKKVVCIQNNFSRLGTYEAYILPPNFLFQK